MFSIVSDANSATKQSFSYGILFFYISVYGTFDVQNNHSLKLDYFSPRHSTSELVCSLANEIVSKVFNDYFNHVSFIRLLISIFLYTVLMFSHDNSLHETVNSSTKRSWRKIIKTSVFRAVSHYFLDLGNFLFTVLNHSTVNRSASELPALDHRTYVRLVRGKRIRWIPDVSPVIAARCQ